jgi:D-alanyl-D-alanine carboxypeptidase/D-alanyl-D-alanine-endopeptidase (penicillin-binding protein 4)
MRLSRFTRPRALAASLALALLPLTAVTPAATARAASPTDGLRAQVLGALAASSAKAWGTEIHLGGVGTVVSRNAGWALPPASTQKLPVAVSLLLATDPGRRLETEVRVTERVTDEGVVRGDLVLVGGGNPVLRTADLAALAREVRAAGIRWVEGDVWADDSRYDRVRRAPGWKPSFVPTHVGPLSALAVDGNAWRRDAAFLADPVSANLAKFRALLVKAGVGVPGASRIGRADADSDVIAVHRSPTIAQLVTLMLKDSNNLIAEMLTKELGYTVARGTTAAGLAAVQQQGSRFGIMRAPMADGSGLSAYDRQSPAGQVRWLRSAADTSVGPLIRSSLPVACGDGTLRWRMCRTAAAGRVRAKTGTLAGVRTLAGYAVTRSGRPVTFAIQLSGVHNGLAARTAIDKAVVAVASYAA